MPLPANVSTGTVTGKFTKTDGSAASGSVSFRPNPRYILDASANVVLTGMSQVDILDGTGSFSLVLAATDDTDLNPVGWTWDVYVELDDQPNIRFSMLVPGGVTTDIADVMPVPSSDGTYYITGPAGPPGTGALAASSAETATGTSTTKWVTPAGLTAKLPWFDVRRYGAALDGVTNDAAAFTAAIAAAVAAGGGQVMFNGPALINSRVTVPNTVGLTGTGSAANINGASYLLCGAAGAGLTVTGNGGPIENFTVYGASVSTNPILIGLCAGRLIQNVVAQSAVQDNWIIDSTQNSTFINCESYAAGRDGVVIDNAAQSNLFLRFEIHSPGRHALYGKETAGANPAGLPTYSIGNTFVTPLFEAGVGGSALVKMDNQNNRIIFLSGVFSHTAGAVPTVPTFDISNLATCQLVEPYIDSWGGPSNIKVSTYARVMVSGGVLFGATAVYDVASAQGLVIIGSPPQYVPGQLVKTAGSTNTVLYGPEQPYGYACNFPPQLAHTYCTMGYANLAWYARVEQGATISKVRIGVIVASGNISVAVYRASGIGVAAVPGVRLATSGAVACPAAGVADIALGSTIDIHPGDYLALSCDNVTAYFSSAGISNVGVPVAAGSGYVEFTAHPLPTTPTPTAAVLGPILLMGVT